MQDRIRIGGAVINLVLEERRLEIVPNGIDRRDRPAGFDLRQLPSPLKLGRVRIARRPKRRQQQEERPFHHRLHAFFNFMRNASTTAGTSEITIIATKRSFRFSCTKGKSPKK